MAAHVLFRTTIAQPDHIDTLCKMVEKMLTPAAPLLCLGLTVFGFILLQSCGETIMQQDQRGGFIRIPFFISEKKKSRLESRAAFVIKRDLLLILCMAG